MTAPPSRRLFAEMVARPDEAVDLGCAALLIACEEYPDLDVPGYLGRLDAMAASVAGRYRRGARSEARLDALNAYLFEDQGFHGNSEDYYDPRNSFLNDVLERHMGIPITLSTVYIEVARRLGLRADGVGLPGHFIVKVATPSGVRLLDPYHGGVPMSETDCQDRLDRIFGGGVRLDSAMLAPYGRKQILARTLRNLQGIYTKAEDFPRALRAIELLLLLEPASGEDLRDRGLVHASLGCYGFAVRDLEGYLTRVPGAPEAGALVEKIVELRRKAARLN